MTHDGIRRAAAADLDAIRTVVEAAYSVYLPLMDKPPGPMLDDYDARIAAGEAHVLEDGGGILGILILIDRDGYEGRFEHEMRHVTKAAGVLYLRCSEGAIQRWAATSGMRQGAAGMDDLPGPGAVAASCDLQALRRERGAGS